MNLLNLLPPGGIEALPLASWLLIAATGGLALLAFVVLLMSLAQGRLSLFVLAWLIAGTALWIGTWMWGEHEALPTDWRAGGWLAAAFILVLASLVAARTMPALPAFLVACLPLLAGLGIADVSAGRSFEWRLVGADRATLARDLGLSEWLGPEFGQADGENGRPSWSDVAEAWRNYAEETKKLDEVINATGSDSGDDL